MRKGAMKKAAVQAETLHVKNFLTIREAKLEVGRFTVVIGPQASGKSVLAKLVYFFRNLLSRQLRYCIEDSQTLRSLLAKALVEFEKLFPRYAWRDSIFEITYANQDLRLTLRRKAGAKGGLVLEHSERLAEIYAESRDQHETELETPDKWLEPYTEHQQRAQALRASGSAFVPPTFIPAGRSFFANLQQSIFTLIAGNVAIDSLVTQFGSDYEKAKFAYSSTGLGPALESKEAALAVAVIRREMDDILGGRFEQINKEDWIVSNDRRVNLSQASSGQQEALPMLMVLTAGMRNRHQSGPVYFVEEPEAHLFPVSQRRLVNVFSVLYSVFDYQFFLTTHSPYILSAINNLALAASLTNQSEAAPDRVRKIIDDASPIPFEDIRAYTIENGRLKDIRDADTRLIGINIIDSVSDDFQRQLDQLMAIEMEVGK
jgi:predicted ATPase